MPEAVPTMADFTAALAVRDAGVTALAERVAALEASRPPAPGPQPPPPPATAGFWPSGVCRPGGPGQYTQKSIDEWSARRGRKCTATLTYTRRSGSWVDLVAPGYVLGNWTDPGLTIMVGQPFTPNSLGSRADGAQARWIMANQAEARRHWAAWGEAVRTKEAQGFRVITNLAWEFNGNWFPHSAADAAAFVGAWRVVAGAVRSAHPTAEIGWVVNAGVSQNPPSRQAGDCWPGDEWVDVVGVDAYAHWPKATSPAAVAAREGMPGRILHWRDFALAHGKKFALPEWGVVNKESTGQWDGDNPHFVQWVWDFLWAEAAAGRPVVESYFNDKDPDNVWSDLLGDRPRNPLSAARYFGLWGPA